MLFGRAYSPEKIRVGYALLRSLHAQPDVALFDLRFCLVPQPIIEVAIYLVGSPSEFIRRHSPQQFDAPVIFLQSAHEAFRQGFRAGFDELDQFEGEHKVPPDGKMYSERQAECIAGPRPSSSDRIVRFSAGKRFRSKCPRSSPGAELPQVVNDPLKG